MTLSDIGIIFLTSGNTLLVFGSVIFDNENTNFPLFASSSQINAIFSNNEKSFIIIISNFFNSSNTLSLDFQYSLNIIYF